MLSAPQTQFGGIANVSGGINGPEGGMGMHASGSFFEHQVGGLVGVEGFRVWRQPAHLHPYVRGSLGLLEVARHQETWILGGLSPRGEIGLLWLDSQYRGLTLGAAAEYRPRTDGLSTPVFWIQLGFGAFDYLR